ncbi:MAG TPA: adenylate/guanylate cyclase domain-containing protein [Microvirga sp.]|nr:adenylate/guanylate cyclase domain-containing protein [Microvirga sp.]
MKPPRSSEGEFWTDADQELLNAADLKAEQTSALLRLAAAILVACLLVGFALTISRWNQWVVIVVGSYLLLAGMGVFITQAGMFRSALPWLTALADAVFFFSVAWLGPWFDVLPAGFRAALVSPWGMFVILALAAVAANARIIALQTSLLLVAFAILVWWPSGTSSVDLGAADLAPLFSDGSNIVRLMLILMTGFVIATGAARSRAALRSAIRAAREREAFRRFIPPEVSQRISQANLEDLRAGSRHTVCLMFIDIRGFTSLSETLEPERIVALLNSFRIRAEHVVARYGGVIDKFIGDGLLVVFGLSSAGQEDAARALGAAQDIVAEMKRWSEKRVKFGRIPIDVGVGVHMGETFVGAVGGERVEFTVIGDAVNVAQRLEAMTRTVDADIIASQALLTHALHDDAAGWSQWVLLPELHLRGRAQAVIAFSRAR